MSPAASQPGSVRLNKFLAERGVDSRRKCDELIAEGKVSVNGLAVTELGTKIDTTRDTVEVAGFVFRPDELPRKRYYLLNKPPGVVCTNERRELRPRAIDLISDRDKGRIFTVGRLDEESKGLVLLTNDGDFAHRIMHPRFEVPKTYAVKVRGPVDDEALQKVRQGVHLSEGRTGGARVLVRKRTRDFTYVIVTLLEGKNREVRRIFARVGAKIAELKRVRIGNLTDKGLKVGTWRPLLRTEVQDLLEISEGRGEQPEPFEEERGPRPRAGAAAQRAPRQQRRHEPAQQREERSGRAAERKPARTPERRLGSGAARGAARGPGQAAGTRQYAGESAGTKPGGRKSSGGKFAPSKPAGRKFADSKPAGRKTAASQFADSKPRGRKAAGSQLAESRSSGGKLAGSKGSRPSSSRPTRGAKAAGPLHESRGPRPAGGARRGTGRPARGERRR